LIWLVDELPSDKRADSFTDSEEMEERVSSFEFRNGMIMKNGVPFYPTIYIDLHNPDWKEILKDKDFRYYYPYSIGSGDHEEVIDVYTNRGYMDTFTTLAKNGKSFLAAPSRIPSVAISILNCLAYLYNKPKDKEYQFLVRVSDKEIEEVLKAVDTEKLKEAGISVKAFKNHTLLDLEVKKYKKLVKEGKVGMVVIAPARTIARGVDLSMLDTIVVPGTVQGSGKDFSQLIARLYNNTDRHNAEIYLFGYPIRFQYQKIFKRDKVEVKPSYTGLVQAKLLKKEEFIYAMMSGKLVNVLERDSNEIIPLQELPEIAPENEYNHERQLGI
jgi:hypothetical protein